MTIEVDEDLETRRRRPGRTDGRQFYLSDGNHWMIPLPGRVELAPTCLGGPLLPRFPDQPGLDLQFAILLTAPDARTRQGALWLIVAMLLQIRYDLTDDEALHVAFLDDEPDLAAELAAYCLAPVAKALVRISAVAGD